MGGCLKVAAWPFLTLISPIRLSIFWDNETMLRIAQASMVDHVHSGEPRARDMKPAQEHPVHERAYPCLVA